MQGVKIERLCLVVTMMMDDVLKYLILTLFRNGELIFVVKVLNVMFLNIFVNILSIL